MNQREEPDNGTDRARRHMRAAYLNRGRIADQGEAYQPGNRRRRKMTILTKFPGTKIAIVACSAVATLAISGALAWPSSTGGAAASTGAASAPVATSAAGLSPRSSQSSQPSKGSSRSSQPSYSSAPRQAPVTRSRGS